MNYKEYTEAAVKLLSETLTEKGVLLSNNAEKSMTISIINLSLTDSMVDVYATMDATVRLGNNSFKGFHVKTAGKVEAAVDQAIRQLVVHILSDNEVRSYLAK